MDNQQLVSRESKILLNTIQLKDDYTKTHSENVAAYSVAIAEALNLTQQEKEDIKHGSLLHDIGKIGVAEQILNKRGELTEEEYYEIKNHPVKGANMLANSTDLTYEQLGIVLYHHENWDGSGYPEGLKEKEIPFFARIVAVADSFDAMITKRCYQEALDKETAIKELISNKGEQFDPQIIEKLEKINFTPLK